LRLFSFQVFTIITYMHGVRTICLLLGMLAMRGTAGECHLVADYATGRILLSKNGNQPRQVASLTKIASVLSAIEWCGETGIDPANWSFTVPAAAIRGGANPLGLKAGDELTLEAALFAAMMASDNTSAHALAEAIGREMSPTSDAGKGIDVFVERMNGLAARLGMKDTRFVNPHGLDEGAEKGVSTASDLTRLALAAIERPGFLRYGSEREQEVSFLRNGAEVRVKLTNTNELVASRGIDGMKTGTTRLSGPCLIATATRDLPVDGTMAPRRLVVVVVARHVRPWRPAQRGDHLPTIV